MQSQSQHAQAATAAGRRHGCSRSMHKQPQHQLRVVDQDKLLAAEGSPVLGLPDGNDTIGWTEKEVAADKSGNLPWPEEAVEA